jgi:three-Cys-motif partner protein
MAKAKKPKSGVSVPEQPTLFPMPPPAVVEPELKRPKHPVWTENKALLIRQYLVYFVFVTKHGTYIDGFAGPQEPDKPELWAARLVLESHPRWLRQLVFIEANKKKVKLLKALHASQPAREKKEPPRDVEILHGDCNVKVPEWLNSGKLKRGDATFCLLDQWTFECDWATVQAVAKHHTKNFKIEQFYFLANSWLERAIAGAKTSNGKARITKWWAATTGQT